MVKYDVQPYKVPNFKDHCTKAMCYLLIIETAYTSNVARGLGDITKLSNTGLKYTWAAPNQLLG